MLLYVMRHGTTDWNKLNKVLGRTDIPLNEKGFYEAEKAAQELSSENINTVFSSPLMRAVQTAEAIIDRQSGDCEYHIDYRLVEQDFGIYEGIDRLDPDYQKEKRTYFKRYTNGESYFDVAARVYPLIDEIKRNKDKLGNTLIVSHGVVCKIIKSYFEDMGNEEFVSLSLSNCEILKYSI